MIYFQWKFGSVPSKLDSTILSGSKPDVRNDGLTFEAHLRSSSSLMSGRTTWYHIRQLFVLTATVVSSEVTDQCLSLEKVSFGVSCGTSSTTPSIRSGFTPDHTCEKSRLYPRTVHPKISSVSLFVRCFNFLSHPPPFLSYPTHSTHFMALLL